MLHLQLSLAGKRSVTVTTDAATIISITVVTIIMFAAGDGGGVEQGAHFLVPTVQLRLVPPLQVRLALLQDL